VVFTTIFVPDVAALSAAASTSAAASALATTRHARIMRVAWQALVQPAKAVVNAFEITFDGRPPAGRH
jgi:hypothetical protein